MGGASPARSPARSSAYTPTRSRARSSAYTPSRSPARSSAYSPARSPAYSPVRSPAAPASSGEGSSRSCVGNAASLQLEEDTINALSHILCIDKKKAAILLQAAGYDFNTALDLGLSNLARERETEPEVVTSVDHLLQQITLDRKEKKWLRETVISAAKQMGKDGAIEPSLAELKRTHDKMSNSAAKEADLAPGTHAHLQLINPISRLAAAVKACWRYYPRSTQLLAVVHDFFWGALYVSKQQNVLKHHYPWVLVLAQVLVQVQAQGQAPGRGAHRLGQ